MDKAAHRLATKKREKNEGKTENGEIISPPTWEQHGIGLRRTEDGSYLRAPSDPL